MTAINHGSVTLGSAYKRQTPTLLQALGQSLWRALEDAGRRRAAPELRRLAQRWRSIDPALARSSSWTPATTTPAVEERTHDDTDHDPGAGRHAVSR